MSLATVEVRKAPCGCVSTLFHEVWCKLVHGEDARKPPEDPQKVSCDVEDGAVFLHAGGCVTRLSPLGARNLADQLHECAREALKDG